MDQSVFNDGIQNDKIHTDCSYDKKQRLIKTEKKRWDDGQYDDPEGYTQLLIATHTYNGYQIIDTNEMTMHVGGEDEEKSKIMLVCDYDSRYNPTHRIAYNYDTENLEKVVQKSEEFYEYNNKGLETNYKSSTIDVKNLPRVIQTISRSTTYCGPNNDKFESMVSIDAAVSSGSSDYKSVYNYYDEKWNVIKQEVITKKSNTRSNVATYYFEY